MPEHPLKISAEMIIAEIRSSGWPDGSAHSTLHLRTINRVGEPSPPLQDITAKLEGEPLRGHFNKRVRVTLEFFTPDDEGEAGRA